MNILDYGCAKGTVLKRLHGLKPGIIPHLFDVSTMYVRLWERFVPAEQYASYQPKPEWKGRFDLVTSFFAFEHTPDPLKELAAIKQLLKPSGMVYMIVPNVYANVGDFIVADHVHHYSKSSLAYMFGKAGFEVLDIDDTSHFAAYIIVARNSSAKEAVSPDPAELKETQSMAGSMAAYWKGLQDKINMFAAEAGRKKAAIYGAGVYGNFIAANLDNFDQVSFFIDQNPLLQGKSMMGVPVILPSEIPDDIEIVYVGLNPVTASSAIESIDWKKNKPAFFYL